MRFLDQAGVFVSEFSVPVRCLFSIVLQEFCKIQVMPLTGEKVEAVIVKIAPNSAREYSLQ